ncbi:glycerol-3-phosphate dehydrogenase/oxidase [Catellatospora sichuanensis]|uniref:glycerol-3-phosphate dehydrogenase/oxidase n=1 Tax=Catellatospora sichuanensis TaxID=1969805 RepID=UPI0011825DFF|nr:glycerol-3-phosphate dehydrogenase/oxidase [Catellatospora sichuanensis]
MRDRSVSRFAAGALSPERRAADLRRLRDEEFDVLVVGGGVTGVGAALDAASRGLRVALIEASDLAAGTSSRSSKLIHGGLRYLEQLEFPLVHEALRERGLLATRLAPHLVRPVPFLVPLPAETPGVAGVAKRAWHRLYYGAGVALYDAFAGLVGGGRGMPLHKHLTQHGARRLFPSLREQGLAGAIRYYDGQVDDARFVVTVARTAASLGAAVVTGVRAVGLLRQARQVTGVRVSDGVEEFDVRAKTVVAATGVWSDDVSSWLPDARVGFRVRASKGVHLVVPRSAITGEVGLILRTRSSVLFVIPWGGHWIIGTTDTDWELDRAHPAASAKDIDYLLSHVNEVLDRPLRREDIEGVYAGLRPLLRGESDSTSALSREHAVVEPLLGLLLVAGGKFTTYRVMAQDVIDKAVRRLGDVRHSGTAELPLLGADGYEAMWRDRADLARRHELSVGAVEHLLERYGTLTTELLALIDEDRALADPLPGAPEHLSAEVVYAARHEGALHVVDVLARRTRISIETAHRGVQTARRTAELMAPVLGWSAATTESEITAYLARVDAERESQRMPDDAAADAARLTAV